MALVASSVSASSELSIDVSRAVRELNGAWEQYRQSTIKCFKDGIAFGRVCCEWRAKYKAQGSRSGKGFNQVLERIGIPKTTAYRWIRRYEIKHELRAKRNEVKASGLKASNFPANDRRPCQISEREERISFSFLLTAEQRSQFEEDIKALGGRQKVAEMFLDFISGKAFQKRGAQSAHGETFFYRVPQQTA